MAHYRAFLGTAEAAAAAHEAAGGALAQLDVMAADLPELAQAAHTFSRSAAELVERRARTKQLQGAPPITPLVGDRSILAQLPCKVVMVDLKTNF